ncbi:MAG TPA: nickel pincer cofactor biosynthesis protein LarC [Thermodesulfovibrionales bacterium]|nr:nickel pincer cofactor biosynthesis protein LarC [Thermodesulfovibrionales bacterium]
MKIAYFDCFSGISGDMCLGALVDAGASLRVIERELKMIPVRGYRLTSRKVRRSHLAAVKVDVVLTSAPSSKGGIQGKNLSLLRDIEKTIRASSLSEAIKKRGADIFRRIFEAEAKVHGATPSTVHLHELGAVDCIVDIFGTLIGLDMLGVEKIYASPVNLGSGIVETEHGRLPVPAPAVAEILKDTPVYSRGARFELTTPTGAAIIKELSSGFGSMPVMNTLAIGSGAGGRDAEGWPNMLRIFTGDASEAPGSPPLKAGDRRNGSDKIVVIETNIDDMNPQIYESVMEHLFKAGALDVFLTQIIMKKGRPGIKLTALCDKLKKERLSEIILRETTTIGLRYYETERKVLHREIRNIDTPLGKIRVKVASSGKDIVKVMPEYEDCRKIAKKHKIPLIDVMRKINITLENK